MDLDLVAADEMGHGSAWGPACRYGLAGARAMATGMGQCQPELARTGWAAQYGAATAAGAPPYWGMRWQPAARNRPKQAESAYPRPRDRRLSRKTRAAVGKPPGSTYALPAVRTADSHGAKALPIGHQENAKRLLLLLQTTRSRRNISPVQFPNGRVSPVDARHRIAHARSHGRPRRAHLLKPSSRKAWR